MNAHIRIPNTLAATPTLSHLLETHRALTAIRAAEVNMPDAGGDCFGQCLSYIEDEIIEAEVTSARDIAVKLRLFADLMDSDAGEHSEESLMILRIIGDIANLRNPEWRKSYRCDHPLTHLLESDRRFT